MRSTPEDPRAPEFVADLDRIIRSLDQTEKEVLSRMRAPLDNRIPTQDLEKRLEELEVSMSNTKLQPPFSDNIILSIFRCIWGVVTNTV